ncbi:unnamed protein product [Strongylus vulgaris]|uniref:Uncharacterized protein n=1 Tax=Strongylus vulgaris TaxID=40348 RepID=A0A3P7IUN2_STRVU|nr:unnamed protein product [Strongylus vulgaris]
MGFALIVVPESIPQDGHARPGVPARNNLRPGFESSSNLESFAPQPTSQFGFESMHSGAHDGQAHLARTSVDVPGIAPLPPPPPSEFSSVRSPAVTQPPKGGFPTLIPFEPSIDGGALITKISEEVTPEPFVHSTIIKPMNHRVRTTPDPRIIKPPDSLVIIGDYDEDPSPNEAKQKESAEPSEESSEARSIRTLPVEHGVVMPKSFISEEAAIDAKHIRGESNGWRQRYLNDLSSLFVQTAALFPSLSTASVIHDVGIGPCGELAIRATNTSAHLVAAYIENGLFEVHSRVLSIHLSSVLDQLIDVLRET